MQSHSTSPYTKTEILRELQGAERDVSSFLSSLSGDEFIHPVAEGWSPAQHLHHLNVSVNAVARGVAIHPWLLRLRFGRSHVPSRRFEEIRETYRAHLARGGGARGPFVPPRIIPTADEVESRRRELLERWARVNVRLRDALDRWSEERLDSVRLPHPLLGKLTVREMLFFTIYHNRHHIAAAQRRLPRFAATPLPGTTPAT